MRKTALGPLVATVMLVSGSLMWAQELTWVTIDAGGTERGAFVPRNTPYTQGGPSVGVYLLDRQDVRMPDGLVLTGFDFIGWREGGATRVQVFALVPKDGVPNTYLPDGDPRNLTRRDFANYLVGSGDSRAITEMRALGIDAMTLRSVARTAPR